MNCQIFKDHKTQKKKKWKKIQVHNPLIFEYGNDTYYINVNILMNITYGISYRNEKDCKVYLTNVSWTMALSIETLIQNDYLYVTIGVR